MQTWASTARKCRRAPVEVAPVSNGHMADHEGAAVASNYAAICEENRQRYGTDIGRIGPMLLADRYDDRMHFIFELLSRRGGVGS
jgi:hypothetical protein